jgi:hypothetical protein
MIKYLYLNRYCIIFQNFKTGILKHSTYIPTIKCGQEGRRSAVPLPPTGADLHLHFSPLSYDSTVYNLSTEYNLPFLLNRKGWFLRIYHHLGTQLYGITFGLRFL